MSAWIKIIRGDGDGDDFLSPLFASWKSLNAGMIALFVATTTISTPSWGQLPAQEPLLSRDGGSVKPNIMLTVDDSGSMAWPQMPDAGATIFVGNFTTTLPSFVANLHPSEPGYFGDRSTAAAITNSTNWRQMALRSSDVNSIYYNPAVRYLPWIQADETRMPDAVVTAVRIDPMSNSGGAINLTNVSNVNARWCYGTNTTAGCADRNIQNNPGLFYVLNRDGSGNYLNPTNSANYTKYDINQNGSTFPRAATRLDCTTSTTSCTQDEERRNFANWFQYYRTRILMAKAALAESFVGATDVYRVGWGRINKGNSSIDGVNTRVIEQGVRDFTPAHKIALYDWIFNTVQPTGSTPLRTALDTVGKYYERSDGRGPWSDQPGVGSGAPDKTCRRSYNVLTTDGLWNDSISTAENQDNSNGATIVGPGLSFQYTPVRPFRDGQSNTLADFAMKYWKNDLRPDLDNKVVPSAQNPAFWQHMVNFTVGLGVRGTLDPAQDLLALTDGSKSWGGDKIDDLWHAALNSRGEFFSAKDPAELAGAIRSSFGQAVSNELKEAGVAAAAVVLEAGNRKYIPKYQTGIWDGDVDAFTLDANGQAGPKVWSALSKLPTWGQRNIVTWDTGLGTPSAVTFTWATLSPANRTALGSSATSTLVDYLKGDRANESSSAFRVRNSVLGDFVNSNPVFAKDGLNEGYVALPTIGATYPAYLSQKTARDGVLYVGGNDGMVHGFLETKGVTPANDGKEIFAYVPRAVYPNLHKLADQGYGTLLNPHQYFVDGPAREFDAHVRAPGASVSSWRNYLVGTLGAGGKAVYAIDITDPSNLNASSVRWELSSDNDPDIGYSTSAVEVGVLPNGKWVAVFGNGYSEAASSKAYLFVVDLETGAFNKIPVNPGATGNGLGGVAIKKNALAQIVSIYAGDLKGKLWKFDFDSGSASSFVVANGGNPLFSAEDAAGNPQLIFQAPLLFDHSLGGTIVTFGTGRLLTTADLSSTATQTIYGVWEKPADVMGPPYNRLQLELRTLSTQTAPGGATFFEINGSNVDWNTQRGWAIDLTVPGFNGLRNIYAPQRVGQTLGLFSTVAPAQNVEPCNSDEGQGVNFVFPIETGKGPDYCLFDTNGDGEFNTADICSAAGYKTGADGIDSVLRSPVSTCSGGVCVTKFSIQNTTGQMTIAEKLPSPPLPSGVTRDRIWRRIINPPIQ